MPKGKGHLLQKVHGSVMPEEEGFWLRSSQFGRGGVEVNLEAGTGSQGDERHEIRTFFVQNEHKCRL